MSQLRISVRWVAAWLLFAWLFALGTNVAHACGLATRAGADLHHRQGAAVAAPHHGARALHDFDGSHPRPEKASCIKFYDDTKAVTHLVKWVDDGAASALPTFPWPASKAWSAAAGGGRDLARAQARSERPPLPVAIEFLRLAL